jgi:hypothetical protein
MNINQRISELGAGGLPRYNRKINEVIETVNWLMGMRTTTGKISEESRGPVIDVGPAVGTAGPGAQPEPWLLDPDGGTAGWIQYSVCIGSQTSVQFFWGSYYPNGVENPNPAQIASTRTATKSATPSPSSAADITKDPNGVTAGWYLYPVCIGGQVLHQWFWGTFVSGQMFMRGVGAGESVETAESVKLTTEFMGSAIEPSADTPATRAVGEKNGIG